jgi:hypothetical protein
MREQDRNEFPGHQFEIFGVELQQVPLKWKKALPFVDPVASDCLRFLIIIQEQNKSL